MTLTDPTGTGSVSGVDERVPTEDPVEEKSGHPFDLATLGALAAALIGLGFGASRLGDNSFFTHLATGREMLDSGIVRSDVFTWTSAGESVVVQSWLASLLYGVVDDLAGFHGLRLLTAVTAAALGALSWRLTAPSPSIVTRVAVLVPAMAIGYLTWTERPLLLAFVAFAVTIVAVEGDRDRRGLIVVGALWVNLHGSWPLGIAYLVARLFGAALDRESTHAERSALTWLGAGILAGGVLNPYGPALLWFPVELLGRQDVLARVVEWQSPSFDSTWTRAFLVMVLASMVALMGRRSWRDAAPVMLFVAAALVGRRNIPLAALVMLPVLARGLPAIGRLSARHTSDAVRLGVIGLAGLLVAVPAVAMNGPHVDVDRYPVEAITAMEDELGLAPGATRIIHQDFVGNYLDLRYGDAAATWIDDRFELHDPDLVEDYIVLLDGAPDWQDVLDRHDAEAILWPRAGVLVELARDVAGWHEVWQSDEWTVLCAPGHPACA